jgi:hypothetical protein
MKVVLKTSRSLKLQQTNWMPWYGHATLWPIAGLLLLMSLAGNTSNLTCRRSIGQCQIDNDVYSSSSDKGNVHEKKTIAIDSVSKVDVIATDNTSETPEAQMVLVTKDGEVNVGLAGSYTERDEAAGKLAWFFEDNTSQFIEIKESDKPITGFLGLTGLSMILAALLFRKTSVVSFDKDTDRCTVQLSRFFGLLKGRREMCELPHIKSVELSGSLKVAADRILVQHSSGANFFLTDYATKDPRIELAAVNSIRDFLNLPASKANVQDDFNANQGWTEESNTSEFYSTSSEYGSTESNTSNFYSPSTESSTSASSSTSDSSSSSSDSSDSSSSSSSD